LFHFCRPCHPLIYCPFSLSMVAPFGHSLLRIHYPFHVFCCQWWLPCCTEERTSLVSIGVQRRTCSTKLTLGERKTHSGWIRTACDKLIFRKRQSFLQSARSQPFSQFCEILCCKKSAFWYRFSRAFMPPHEWLCVRNQYVSLVLSLPSVREKQLNAAWKIYVAEPPIPARAWSGSRGHLNAIWLKDMSQSNEVNWFKRQYTI
jgi:hypothetical protein